jgi:hypothetical protein
LFDEGYPLAVFQSIKFNKGIRIKLAKIIITNIENVKDSWSIFDYFS